MISISHGQYLIRTRAQRQHVESVRDLAIFIGRLTGTEAWWSGHLWAEDTRRVANWRSSQVIVVDVDWHQDDRHAEPPDDVREQVVQIDCSLWHHTPRGLRVVYVLDLAVGDATRVQLLQKAAARRITLSGLPEGYRVDEQATDLARLVYAPRATVAGVERSADVAVERDEPWSHAQLMDHGVDVSALLARMDVDGGNDGSAALVRVAAQAVRAGVRTPEDFIEAACAWNSQRAEPWSDGALALRFHDAQTRHLAAGTVLIPTAPDGKPACNLAVLLQILEEDPQYAGRLALNEMGDVVHLDGQPLVRGDAYTTEVRVDLVQRYKIKPTKADVQDAILGAATRHAYHPVRQYLDGLVWDGQERISRVVGDVLVSTDVSAPTYLRRWFISAVARGLGPGCKVDTVIVLIGRQGIGKSSFFATLAGGWFADTSLDLSNKDAYLGVHRVWIYEMAELGGIYRRADANRIKSFLSARTDLYRAPYARAAEDHARGFVVVGTANEVDILRDDTGSRRFWPMLTTAVHLPCVAEWRDQLWAEAVHLYRAGEQWWLTDDEEELRAEEADAYGQEDVLDDAIADLLARTRDGGLSDRLRREGSLTMGDFLDALVCAPGVDVSALSTSHAVGARLRARGWTRRLGGRHRRRRWFPPEGV